MYVSEVLSEEERNYCVVVISIVSGANYMTKKGLIRDDFLRFILWPSFIESFDKIKYFWILINHNAHSVYKHRNVRYSASEFFRGSVDPRLVIKYFSLPMPLRQLKMVLGYYVVSEAVITITTTMIIPIYFCIISHIIRQCTIYL